MWKLIKIDFADTNELKNNIFKITEFLDAEMRCQSLFFARYIGPQVAFAQVSVQTEQYGDNHIDQLKNLFPAIQEITVIDRNSESRVFGLGYKICRELSLLDSARLEKQLCEVVHWMHNMVGFAYQDESGKYLSYAREAWRGLFQDNIIIFRSGESTTTQIGFVNRNRQANHGTLGVAGNGHLQYAFRLECINCGYVYGANGADIAERKCPECQGGEPGIRYRT